MKSRPLPHAPQPQGFSSERHDQPATAHPQAQDRASSRQDGPSRLLPTHADRPQHPLRDQRPHRGIAHGGIGTFHRRARRLGLSEWMDQRLHLLKIHLPYHESDHVLALADNALCDGTWLQDLERRRQDETFLDALGARRLPDPTTAGAFCRRFDRSSIHTLLDISDDTRLQAWATQPAGFFAQATIAMDGTRTATDGACKQGMDSADDGTGGYPPLVLSVANTRE